MKEEIKWKLKIESILMKTCLRSTLKLIIMMCFSYFQLFGLCLCVNQITLSYFPRIAKYCTENICSFMDLVESPIYSFMGGKIIKIWKKFFHNFISFFSTPCQYYLIFFGTISNTSTIVDIGHRKMSDTLFIVLEGTL